jgi:hypothetical protein
MLGAFQILTVTRLAANSYVKMLSTAASKKGVCTVIGSPCRVSGTASRRTEDRNQRRVKERRRKRHLRRCQGFLPSEDSQTLCNLNKSDAVIKKKKEKKKRSHQARHHTRLINLALLTLQGPACMVDPENLESYMVETKFEFTL